MANTRELSQLASIINILDQTKSIGIITEYPDAKVGIGTLLPTSKVDVVGDVNVSGAITATTFYGDGSNITGLSTFSGDYNDLSNKPEIPSDTSDLTNNAGFVTSSIVVGLASEGYVTQQISNLIGGAPEALDTLNELAAALNDDQNFATSITNSLVGLASEGYVNNLVAISTFSGDYNDLSNKPEIPSIVGLASEGYVDTAVSGVSTFSGDYNDLSNKPEIPSIVGLASEGYVNNLVAISTFSGDYNDLSNQPSIPSIVGLASEGYVNNLVAISTFSGDYNDLSNKPEIPSIVGLASEGYVDSQVGIATAGLASVSYVDNLVSISTFSGNYEDLTGKPNIPQSGVDFDPAGTDNSTNVTLSGSYDYLTLSNQQITLNQIDASTDVSGLSTIATSGNYNDLLNRPQIPSDTSDLTNNAGFVTSEIIAGLASEGYVNNLVAISTFSGDYNDLSNQPSIPSIVGLASEGYVDVAVANLVDSAPSTLDTLNELAAALGDDANFSTTITNNLANKADLSGANFTGVVTATTFYGDGSNLSNIISGVGINSNGVIVGTGITTLNFLGTGTTISISGQIADISINSEPSPGKESYTFVASEGQTTFSVLYSVGYIDVYLNGIRLSSNEFAADTGDSVILNEGASAGDILDVIEYTMGAGLRGPEGPSGPLPVESAVSDETYNPIFALGIGTTTAYTNSNLTFNPSTGALTALAFFGDGSGLTGVSGSGIGTEDSINTSGIITASAFYGDGSGLTGAGSTVSDDTTTDETFYPIFTQTTTGTVTSTKVSTTNLSFNPFTGNLSAVDFNSTSDQNLKENIEIIQNPIEKVLKISGVTFDWKSSQQSSAGVIAQEVEKVLPEIVKENDGHKSVSYNGLIGLLIEVVKEQQEQINTLRNKIENLEEKM